MGSRTSRSLVSVTLCVLTLGVLGAGCATAGEGAKHGLGAGEWQARLPTTQSPIQELAYGRGGNAQRADLTLDDVLLQPKAARPVALLPVAKAKPVRHQVAAAPVVAQAEPTVLPATAAEAPSTLLAQNDSDLRYADREAQAQKLQEFKGGDVIVISAGAIVLVLLIVLLILLLR